MRKDAKTLVLVFTLLFVVYLMLVLFFDKLRGLDSVSLGALSCMTFLLGGPIVYVFVNAADARFDLNTPWGKVSLVGGYAVGTAAAVIIWMAPDSDQAPPRIK